MQALCKLAPRHHAVSAEEAEASRVKMTPLEEETVEQPALEEETVEQPLHI
jgi:hypothetical protein